MSENPLKKFFPVSVFALNLIIAGITSGKGAPLEVMAGFKAESLGAALFGTAIGVIVALVARQSLRIVFCFIAFPVAIVTLVCYGALSSAAGASVPMIIVIFLVYGIFYISVGYVLAFLEIAVKDWFANRNGE
jgi:hypothetical protein